MFFSVVGRRSGVTPAAQRLLELLRGYCDALPQPRLLACGAVPRATQGADPSSVVADALQLPPAFAARLLDERIRERVARGVRAQAGADILFDLHVQQGEGTPPMCARFLAAVACILREL